MTTNKDALDVSKLLEDLDYVLDKHGAYNHGEENEFFHLNIYERVKNALQTQAELVEALKEARKIIHEHRIFTIGQRFETDKEQSELISKIDKALYNAEKESGE